MQAKGEAREKARAMLRECGTEYLRSADSAALRRLFGLPEYKNARLIFTYVGIGPEPDTVPLIERALSDKKLVAVPLITGQGLMEARLITSLGELSPGVFGIPEPLESAPCAQLEENDLIIVPAAAFSRGMQRLGRGGGYYDRFLARNRGIKIGIAREKLLLDRLPAEAHDIPADIIVTELRTYKK